MTLPDRFATAMPIAEFIDQAKSNKDLWIAVSRRAEAPSELVERLQALPERRHLLVLAEDWCADALGTLPPLARLVEQVPQLELRVLSRDENLDVMDAHLTGGKRAIPVVIVLDENLEECAWWGSRPAALQRWVASPEAQRLTKEERYKEIRRWYSTDRGRTALGEIATLVQSCAALNDAA